MPWRISGGPKPLAAASPPGRSPPRGRASRRRRAVSPCMLIPVSSSGRRRSGASGRSVWLQRRAWPPLRWLSACRWPWPRLLTGAYDAVLRLPACQSSSVPAVPGSTPKLRSCGRSRRLRLSSAKPGKPARAVTWSQSRTASSGPGSLLITGPKNAAPSGGLKWMIGVPTSRPVSDSASSPSARISSSHRVSSRASARPAGRPAAASSGSTKARLPRWRASARRHRERRRSRC